VKGEDALRVKIPASFIRIIMYDKIIALKAEGRSFGCDLCGKYGFKPY
jgi:hypothetical protein